MFRKIIAQPFRSSFRHNVRFVANLVLAKEFNDKGLLTLNRPNQMNAVNYGMIENISSIVKKWKNNKSMIIVKGSGNKAFSVGGDIPQIIKCDSLRFRKRILQQKMDAVHLIGTLNIPYISLIDGLTLGMGAGLSMHGRYSIATERTIWAMPEITIGLYPGAGCSYTLPRLQGKLGFYLGLTGFQLKGGQFVRNLFFFFL